MIFPGIAPSDSRRWCECPFSLTIRVEIREDSFEILSTHGTYCYSRPFFWDSRLVFLEELSQVLLSVELLLPQFVSLELPSLGFPSVLAMSSVSSQGFLPRESWKRRMRSLNLNKLWTSLERSGSFILTGGLPGSTIILGGALDLVVANSISVTECS